MKVEAHESGKIVMTADRQEEREFIRAHYLMGKPWPQVIDPDDASLAVVTMFRVEDEDGKDEYGFRIEPR